MTGRDAETFRRFHELWTDGDLAGALELVDDDVVARPIHGVLYSRSEYRGHAGLEEWFAEMTGPWERYEVLVEEVSDAPDGVLGILRLVGHRHGEALHARVGVECVLRDGKIVVLVARDAGELAAQMRERRGS